MKTREDVNVDGSNRTATIVTIGVVLAIAAFGLLGYIPGWSRLGSLHLDFIPMAPSTAISFVLLATALLLGDGIIQRRYRHLYRTVALVVSVFGFLKFAEFCFGVNKSFEELIIGSTAKLGEVPIGIMSPATGAIFVLAGVSMLLYSFRQIKNRENAFLRNLSGSFGCAVIFGSLTFILGYFYGTPLLYGAGRVVPMAITTAVAFLLLGVSLLITHGKNYFPLALFTGPSVSARMMRVFVPVIAFSVIGIDIAGHLWPKTFGNQSDPIVNAVAVTIFAIATIVIVLRLGGALGKKIDEAETERKKAEKGLRKSEEKFHKAFASSPDSITISRLADGRMVDVNASFERTLGYTRQEVVGQTTLDLGLFVDPAIRKLGIDTIQREGRLRNFELEMRHKSGSILTCRLSAEIIDLDGEPHLLATTKDVTEQKLADQALRESEEKYRSLLSNIPSVVWTSDRNGHTSFISQNVEQVCGYTPAEIYENGDALWSGRIHPDDLESVANALEALVKDSQPFDEQYRIQRKDGQWIWLHDRADRAYDDQGTMTVEGVFSDITERKRAEEAFESAKEFTDNLLEAMTDGLSVLDQHGVQIDVNPAFCGMTGFSREELVGVGPPHPFWPGEQLEAIEEAFRKTLQGEFEPYELMFMRKNGERFPVLVSPSCIKNEAGEIISFFATVKDISDRKRAEILVKSRLKLERLGYEISRSFANAEVGEIDQAVNSALEKIARFANANRSSLFVFSDDLETVTNTHEWCASPEDSQIAMLKSVPFSTFGWHRTELLQLRTIAVSKPDDYPPEAKGEKEWIKNHGFRALLFIPLLKQERLHGALGFYGEIGKEATWTTELIDMLKTVGNIILNILERKSAEKVALEKQKQLDELLENVDAIVLEGDPYDIYFVGGNVKKILGYPVEEWFKDQNGPVGFWSRHLHADDKDNFKACAEAIANCEDHSFEYRMIAADGRVIWFYCSVTVESNNGLPVKARTIMIDITDRKEAEEEIARLHKKLELENEYLREEVRQSHSVGGIIGHSMALKKIMDQINLVAPTDSSVLITGESGTGKELIARAIHELSNRRDHPMISVNCASIPRDLFESEFFGHVKGAFTGAIKDRIGRFQMADGGTIFLDEVGEIPLESQSKLLRVLQEGLFELIGDGLSHHVNVRVIAATNRDLEKEVASQRFRQDLYYRLSVFPIKVPALRDRLEDIPILAEHFVEESCMKLGVPKFNLKKKHVYQLQQYSWPGNIRELQNVIERALIVSREGSLLLDLPQTRTDMSHKTILDQSATSTTDREMLTYPELRRLEKDNLLAALEKSAWKVAGSGGAAEILNANPSTLASRIKVLGIIPGSNK